MAVVELFKLVAEEIAAEPTTFAIEVVQFLILVLIVWVVAWGFGKRRGFLRNMLAEHQARIVRQLEEAEGAEQDLASARDRARASVEAAKAEARRTRESARERSKQVLEIDRAAVDREVDAMRKHAKELLALEREEMLSNAREHLLDVVGRATRHILSDGLSPAEQRSLIQRSIMESLGPGNGHKKQRAAASTAAPRR